MRNLSVKKTVYGLRDTAGKYLYMEDIMAVREKFNWSDIRKGSPYFSCIKTTIETAFMGNNVYPVETPKKAYKLACESPGTIITDIPIFEPEKMGLAEDSKVLLFNDGAVKGRCAAARRILGEPGVDAEEYAIKIRDAIYDTRYKNMY